MFLSSFGPVKNILRGKACTGLFQCWVVNVLVLWGIWIHWLVSEVVSVQEHFSRQVRSPNGARVSASSAPFTWSSQQCRRVWMRLSHKPAVWPGLRLSYKPAIVLQANRVAQLFEDSKLQCWGLTSPLCLESSLWSLLITSNSSGWPDSLPKLSPEPVHLGLHGRPRDDGSRLVHAVVRERTPLKLM